VIEQKQEERDTPPLWCFIGDMHTGGQTALVTDPRNNPQQDWLIGRWKYTTKEIIRRARGHEFGLRLGGDLVDLPGLAARDMAYDLLRPLVNRADKNIYGVPGTEYHVGENGDEDRSIYGQCAAKVRQFFRLQTAGKVVHWAHHLVKVGNTPWTELNGMKQAAESAYFTALQTGERQPDLIVGHHVHRVPHQSPIIWRNITVAIAPCWQLPTSFAAKVAAGKPPTIGALLYYPAEHRTEYITHDIPEKIAFS